MLSLGFHFPGVRTGALGQRLLIKGEGRSCSFQCGIEGKTLTETFLRVWTYINTLSRKLQELHIISDLSSSFVHLFFLYN